MSNQATMAGIEAVNKNRQTEVSNKAQSLISMILSNRKSVKGYNVQIEDEQKKLAAIADDVVTQQLVLGTEFSAPLNPNQVTIVDAIKKINDAKQESVRLNSQHHTNNILRIQATIKEIEKSTADLVKQLNELSTDVVTVSMVTGPTV